jgi:hypothetical protein
MTDASVVIDDQQFEMSSPAVCEDVIVRHYEDELVVWSPEGLAPVRLDPVAGLVFQFLDGATTLGEIIADVHDVIGVPVTVVRSQLRRIISELDQAGVFAESPNREATNRSIEVFPGPPNP